MEDRKREWEATPHDSDVDGDVPDIRCDICREMGVECPMGYPVKELICRVCGYDFAAMGLGCALPLEDAGCPECGLRELRVMRR